MQNKVKVLIGNNSSEFGIACSEILLGKDFEVTLVPSNGLQVLDKIKAVWPDIIVIETFMPQFDAVSILMEIKQFKSYRPSFVIINETPNETLENEVLRNGAYSFITKPTSIPMFCERIVEIGNVIRRLDMKDFQNYVEPKKQIPREELEYIVTDVMLNLGIPAHVKGYHYIRHAIMLSIENAKMMDSVTKVLYPKVAEKFETSPSRVERAIRHAIEIAWNRGDVDILNKYFAYTIDDSRGKPTNSEFIAMVSDKLRLEMQRKNFSF